MTQTVEIDYKPRPYFLGYHNRETRFACIVAHRRAGKTTACIHELQRAAVTQRKPRPRYAYIAPLLKQSKAVAWDILKSAVVPLMAHKATVNESELRVDYPNGGQIRLYGADNPDALRGIYLDGVVLDEPAQMDGTLFREVIAPALADRGGQATYIGTPKGHDAFYSIWSQALRTPAEWYTARLPVSFTKIINDEELAAQRRIQSEAQYAREWECSFDEPDVAQLIPTPDVEAARKRTTGMRGVRVLGVDVARYGDDRSVVLLRDGDVVLNENITIWHGIDLMQTAARVAEIIERVKPQAVFVDGVGVGGGVVDRLRQTNYKVVDVNAGGQALHDDRYANLRAEMWGKVRDWVKDRGQIPDREDLALDLTAQRYEYDARGRIKLERKEEMKSRGVASPDLGDALALTFARPVAMSKGELGPIGGQRDYGVPEADPLAGF